MAGSLGLCLRDLGNTTLFKSTNFVEDSQNPLKLGPNSASGPRIFLPGDLKLLIC